MTKKLVTILAEKIQNWPDGAIYALQNCMENSPEYLQIYFYGDCGDDSDFCSNEFAEDAEHADVTLDQWEAERARILLESQPERDPFIKELVEIACKNKRLPDVNDIDVAYLNQALWDEVAIAAMNGLISCDAFHGFLYQQNPENAAIFGADCADAFMAERAERAKRMK